MNDRETLLVEEVKRELIRANTLFAPIVSMHEALGVIREEYAEFEQDVYQFNLRKGRDTRAHARTELIQLAAMALKAVTMIDFQTNSNLPN